MREGKEENRKRLENKLQQNNMNNFWPGMKNIIGFKERGFRSM